MIVDTEIISVDTVRVTAVSDMTGSVSSLDIKISPDDFLYGLAIWQDGEMIQNAFPNLKSSEREFIMTGIHPIEWEEKFGA